MESSQPVHEEQEEQNRDRSWLLLLLALLMSFACVFCSASLALVRSSERVVEADMLAQSEADYSRDDDQPFAPLDPDIIEEMATDTAGLRATPSSQGTPPPVTDGGTPIVLHYPTPTPTVLPPPEFSTPGPTNTAVSTTPSETPPPTLTRPPTRQPTTTPIQPSVTTTATPTFTPSPFVTLTPTASPTAVPTSTPLPPPPPTPIVVPTVTHTPLPPPTPVPTAVPLPTQTPTSPPASTSTATPIPSATNTLTPGSTSTATSTTTATATETTTPTAVPTSTQTSTQTSTPTQTATPTLTPTQTGTPTTTPTSTNTPTATPTLTPTPMSEVLMVVGNTVLSPADTAIRNRVEGLGYIVVLVDDNAAVPGDANGKALVLISPTSISTILDTTFRDVTVPVLATEALIYDEMGMTAVGDNGGLNAQTVIDIIDAGHPLAAGLPAGPVTVLTFPGEIRWGIPGASADMVATLAGDPTRYTIFSYDTGDPMFGLNAPARRVGFFLSINTAVTLSSEGWLLFDAAFAWAVN